MYVTVFSPASVVKFSLAPTGATCEGSIDINALVGTSLMGDFEFISEDRAQVVACIGQSGVVRMDASGDLVDPVDNDIPLFDPMKTIFIPEDSIMLVQSSGGSGGTFKLESDYSLTQIANSSYMSNYNNELASMAGGNIVRVENHDGFLGLITEQLDGSFDESVRLYSGGFGFGEASTQFGLDVSPNGTRLLTSVDLNTLGLYSTNGHGMPILEQTFSNPLGANAGNVVYISDNQALLWNSSSNAVLVEIDEQNGTANTQSIQAISGWSASTVWDQAYDEAGQTLITVPVVGNTFHYFRILPGNMLDAPQMLSLPGINVSSKLTVALSPSGSKAYVLAEHGCNADLIELHRNGQTWTVGGSVNLMSAGISWTCDDHFITFLESDSRIAISGDGSVKIIDLSAGVNLLTTYVVSGLESGFLAREVSYNADHGQVMLVGSDWNGFSALNSQMLFLAHNSGAIYAETASFVNNSGDVSALNNINQLVSTTDGNLVYAMALNGNVIHTFGVSDITVGINEQGDAPFTMFPNPTTAELNISFDDQFTGTVTVVDNTGREVSSVPFSGTRLNLDIQDQPSGIYHVRTLSTSGELNTTSVVKN